MVPHPEHTPFLLKKLDGRWSIVEYGVGPSEVLWKNRITTHNLASSLVLSQSAIEASSATTVANVGGGLGP
jgi:hypothetical protein